MFVDVGGIQQWPEIEGAGDKPVHVGTPTRRAGVRVPTACRTHDNASLKRFDPNLYNARPAWLDHAHRALVEAVALAYGWSDYFPAGTISDDEVVARLLRLNRERDGK